MSDFMKYLPAGAEYEMRTERTKTNSVSFDGNQLESINSADRILQTARVLHNSKLSAASGSKPGNEAELIKQAAETVKFGSAHDVPFVGAENIAPMNLECADTLTSKEMTDIAAGLMADIRRLDSHLSAGARFTSTLTEISMKTSNGFNSSYRKSVWSLSAFLSLAQGDDSLDIYEYKVNMGPKFDVSEITNVVAQKLEYAKNTVSFKAGAYPVIFTPEQVGFVINPVLASLNGMAVYRQMSPWSNKLGEELLDSRFTLIDDGSLDNEWTSRPFDVEGTSSRRNVLVQNGRIHDLILDRKAARFLGKESTGNASTSGPSPIHLRLDAGDKPLEELIRSIDYGLLIDDTMGAWSGNPYSGIVTGTISMGLLIEKGKIAGRVKDCMFTVNAFEHLQKHLVDCSAEREQCGVRGGTTALFPYVMLDEVVISTKQID
ncbi:MAG: TldD/PmbA family protein [Firmicutes bacterium]|nr:TldD/PmbA family protein [Bacillota bacterium]